MGRRGQIVAAGLLLARLVALSVLVSLSAAMAGCAPREASWRWAEAGGAGAGGAVGGDRVAVHAAVAPTLLALLERLEPLYEAASPGVDLVLHGGVRTGELDRAQWLSMRLERGARADLFVAEAAWQVDELTRTPRGRQPWLGNALAVIAPRGSGLDRRGLASGAAPVHIALARTALGRWTRRSLRASGLWGDVSLAAGLYDNADAIVQRVGHGARGAPAGYGVVLASDAVAASAGAGGPVRVVGYLDQPPGEPTVHELAWFTDEGGDLARWLADSEDARSAAAAMGFVVRAGGTR